MSNKLGRPVTVPGGLSAVLYIRVSQKFARELRKRARFAGKKLAEYIRERLQGE